jgi:hypothetical protein
MYVYMHFTMEQHVYENVIVKSDKKCVFLEIGQSLSKVQYLEQLIFSCVYSLRSTSVEICYLCGGKQVEQQCIESFLSLD